MHTIVQANISVNGRETNLTRKARLLTISSRFDGHHSFTLQVPLHREDNVDLAELEEHLGEKIEIDYGKSASESSTFIGFIDEIVPSWTEEGGRIITMKGWSPTVFLDCGPAFRCFSETTLDSVVKTVLKPYRKFFKGIELRTSSNQQISWSVQANETDFNYLCRLADQSGQQELWYDGQSLFFDNLTRSANEEIRLTKGENLLNLSLSLNTAPLSFAVKTYDYIHGGFPQAEVGRMTSSNPLINAALRKSGVYPIQNIFLPYAMEGNNGMRPLIRRFASKQAHELLVLSGQSNDPRLVIGSKITIDAKDNLLDNELSGQFVVIHINHQINKDGQYGNGFAAVPTSHPYNLRMSVGRSPMCGPMAAEVVDCNDPARLGRVKVRFFADEQKAESPWLRCLTGYTAGGGVFQVPFKGDHVMVMPEGDFNLESGALVLGAYFHKNCNAKKWNPTTERGIRHNGTGLLFTQEAVNTWGDNVQGNARKSWSWDGPRGDLNSGKGSIPQ